MRKKYGTRIQSNDDMYSSYYSDTAWNEFRYIDAARYLHSLEHTVLFRNKDVVLEVGCGTAEFARIVRNTYGSRVYGMDMNAVAIKQAKKNGVKAYMQDIEKRWPFTNGTFTHVIATQIIEHLVNPDVMMTEAIRVLKPGGYFIVATPNLGAWFNRILVPLGYQPFFTEVSTVDKTFGLGFTRGLTPVRKPLGHLRCFTLSALREMMQYYGFDVIIEKGATVAYLPRYVTMLDKLFSLFPPLATDLLVVGRKKE